MRVQEFDYVVVGAGSAGCVVASRLTEDPSISVCLLEAGGKDSSAFVQAPAGFAATVPQGIFSWHFNTVPQKGLNNRLGIQPRGKLLGGSSSINAMVYCRGNKWDYDNWASLGNDGWSYDDVLPYFKRSENNETLGDNKFHGKGGPLNVAELRAPSTYNNHFLAACQEQGIPLSKDLNGENQAGCRINQVTQLNGERCSTAKSYITPHLDRPNLTVFTQAVVSRVEIVDNVATGVSFYKGKKLLTVSARHEVILSAGAFGTPQVLQLSGLGPKEHLESKNIEVIKDVPGVGSNLHDHITSIPIYRTKKSSPSQGTFGISIGGAIDILKGIYQWRNKRQGIITTCFAESAAFVYSDNELPAPDIQMEFVVGIVDDHNRKMHLGHGYSLHATLLRPKSRGTVRLADSNPNSAPLIDPNFLDEERDLDVLVIALQKALDIMESKAFDGVKGKMIYPLDRNNVNQLKDYIRNHADTEYHPVGTCKMGEDSDAMAVVNSQLQFRGIQQLRIVDASVMPEIVSGNTNAPTIMIAEKAVDMIKAGRRINL